MGLSPIEQAGLLVGCPVIQVHRLPGRYAPTASCSIGFQLPLKSEGDPLEMQHSRNQPGNEAQPGTSYSEATCEIDQEHESGDDGR
jgi:hypothetical protein